MKANIHQAITSRFIEQLKRGTVPWQKRKSLFRPSGSSRTSLYRGNSDRTRVGAARKNVRFSNPTRCEPCARGRAIALRRRLTRQAVPRWELPRGRLSARRHRIARLLRSSAQRAVPLPVGLGRSSPFTRQRPGRESSSSRDTTRERPMPSNANTGFCKICERENGNPPTG